MNGKLDSTVICDPGETTLRYASRLATRIHPEFVSEVPYELDVAKLEIRQYAARNGELVKGVDIYKYLLKEDLLQKSLGLSEVLAIEFMKNEFHDDYFNGKRVVGWKDAVRRLRDQQILVPFVDKGINVYHGWMWLGAELRSNAPIYLKNK